MSFNLNDKDYKTILEFYNNKIPTSSKDRREEAEKIISLKLCRCIKKVKKNLKKKEGESIGICKKSVLHKKNIDIYGFKCKKKRGLINFPTSKTRKFKKYDASKSKKKSKRKKSKKKQGKKKS
jgi:hypothetical protein